MISGEANPYLLLDANFDSKYTKKPVNLYGSYPVEGHVGSMASKVSGFTYAEGDLLQIENPNDSLVLGRKSCQSTNRDSLLKNSYKLESIDSVFDEEEA